MLDEEFDTDGLSQWREDEDCGCWVTQTVIDGAEVDVHHWTPDDTAPHIPDTECGCGPQLRDDAKGGVLLFEHFDQDDPGISGLWHAAAS